MLLRLWRGLHEHDYQPDGKENWQSFLAACDYHQVSPIVFHRLHECGVEPMVPTEILEQLRSRFYKVSAYNHRLAMRLVELSREFEQRGIRCLALKGPAAAMMAYGDLALRQYEDIDLMIGVEDVAKAVEILFSRGFQPSTGHAERYKRVELYHEATLIAPDESYGVDLHWQLAPPYAKAFGPDLSGLWEGAVKLRLPLGEVRALCREDLFLALCQHGTRHRWWQLKWLFDVGELLRHSPKMDWSRIEDTMKGSRMARSTGSLAALLARELLGIRVSAEVNRILEPGPRTLTVARAIRDEFLSCGQTNGSAHDTLLGLEPRPLVRVKYLAIEAVQYPVKTILFTITGKDVQFVRLPEGLRLLYYLVRPLRLLLQHGRVAARRIWSMAR